MGKNCDDGCEARAINHAPTHRYRRILWIALVVNAAMFLMGGIGLLALAANFGVALLLYAYREGDANMRSVWLCTRNDAIGNVAIVLAALGVFGTGSLWPDVVVAVIMGGLGISAGWHVIQRARLEIKTGVVQKGEDARAH